MKDKKTRLASLKKKMLAADLPLKAGASNLVFGEASCDAPIVFIGEAPGRHEDIHGLPFVGSAGRILDQLLASIPLERKDIYITSILKYRPPKNRNPNFQEILAHTPFLVEQIKIIKPKVVVTLGNFATRFVLAGFNAEKMSKIEGISKLHGRIESASFGRHKMTVIPLYHPAAVLYNPSLRKVLDKDFLIIRNFLEVV